MRKPTGSNASHLLRKLQEAGRSDLVQEITAGRLTAWEGAVEAGIRFRQQPLDLSSNSYKRKAFRRYPLRASKDLEMWLGPSSNQPSLFADTEDAKRYWHANSARLMPLLAGNGTRPQAWWYFDAKMPFPGLDEEAATLFELGEFGELEEREWIPVWRKSFDIAAGLRGIGRIRDFLDKAALPMSLFRKWNAEKRRVAAQIRVLEVEERTKSPR